MQCASYYRWCEKHSHYSTKVYDVNFWIHAGCVVLVLPPIFVLSCSTLFAMGLLKFIRLILERWSTSQRFSSLKSNWMWNRRNLVTQHTTIDAMHKLSPMLNHKIVYDYNERNSRALRFSAWIDLLIWIHFALIVCSLITCQST